MALAIVKQPIWDKLGYVPNEAQEKIHAAAIRNRVVAAGRRTGKSTGGGHELVPCAFQAYYNRRMLEDLGKRQEYWIAGPNYSDSEKEFRVFWNDCKKLGIPFDRPGTYNDARSGSMQISLWGGKFLVQAMSAAHPESLVGEGLFGVIMAEAAKMKESTWSKFIRPTLADFKGWSLFNSTPEGKNWFYDLWKKGKDPNEVDWWSMRAPSWMNSRVFPMGATPEGLKMLMDTYEKGLPITPELRLMSGVDPEIISMWTDLGQEMFNQEVAALFSEYVGRVFKDWDEEVHVTDLAYNSRWPLYIATDYGWTNPNVALFLQVDPFDNVYVIGEYYERGRTDDEFAEDLLNHVRLGPLCAKATNLYGDPEDPGATTVLARKLKLRPQTGTGGQRNIRINLIRKWLKVPNLHLPFGHPDRLPKLLVDRSCTNLVREMDAYRYPQNKSEIKGNAEDPMKKDDHTPEALGRFFAGKYGHTIKRGGRPRQTTAHMG